MRHNAPHAPLAQLSGVRVVAWQCHPHFRVRFLVWMRAPGAPMASLIGRMTLEEKVQQMRDHAPAIPRLGVPQVRLVERRTARRRVFRLCN